MSIKELILSEKKIDRIKRHLLFWGLWGFYFSMVRFLNPYAFKTSGHFENLFTCMGEAFLALLAQAFLAYPLLYFILPRYVFNGKYIKAFLWLILFLFLCFSVTACFFIFIPKLLPAYFTRNLVLFEGMNDWDKIGMAYMAGFQGALTGAALAGGFKLFKHYYVKDLRNQQLHRENTDAQLQLLKAQIHPHFLFNTLNNIYSQAQDESPRSAKMILELSHILRYVLDEGKLVKVPLNNELQMLMDYTNLETIRYDKKVDLHVSLPHETENIYIAPLLLLPFVENCFKHGTSKMLQNPWINLKIELNEEILNMKLINGKKDRIKEQGSRKGTGIENVRQRLDLLYNDNYDLQINEDDEVFVVNLKIKLEKIEAFNADEIVKPHQQKFYA